MVSQLPHGELDTRNLIFFNRFILDMVIAYLLKDSGEFIICLHNALHSNQSSLQPLGQDTDSITTRTSSWWHVFYDKMIVQAAWLYNDVCCKYITCVACREPGLLLSFFLVWKERKENSFPLIKAAGLVSLSWECGLRWVWKSIFSERSLRKNILTEWNNMLVLNKWMKEQWDKKDWKE